MKKVLLLLLCHVSLYTMQKKEQIVWVNKTTPVSVRFSEQSRTIFAQFQPDTYTYAFKNLLTNSFSAQAKCPYVDSHGRQVFLSKNPDPKQVELLKQAIAKFEKTAS